MTAGQCIGGCVLGVSSRGWGLCAPGFCDIIKAQVWSGGAEGRGVNMRPPRPPSLLTLPQLRIPWLLFFFFSSSASRRPRFLWGRKSALLPVTVPFHVVTSSCFARRLTEPRSCFPPAASSGRQAGGTGSSYRRPHAAAFANASVSAGFHNTLRCSWLKSPNFTCRCFHFQNAPSFQNSAIVQTVSTVFFFLSRVFAERNKRLSFFQTRQCYCHSFIQNKIGPQSAAGDQSSVP